ncbi:unnamed protein product [Allacma fusca]|uniref:Uncharacterized protein n=1 Tax=Allacma fusca TaxID=39272 RepID=A0A8J2KLD0_9HEXA|nr:unnamed protein product [Allacma fusca]
MITHTTGNLFREAIFLSKWSGSTEFRWDSKKHRIRLSTASWSKVYRNFNFAQMIAFETFLIYRLIESVAIPTAIRPLSDVINLCYFIGIYAIPTSLHYCTTRHSADIALFVNGFLEYFQKFKESYILPSQYKKKNGCETVLRIFFSTAYLTTLQNVIIFVVSPHRYFMLTSLIWDSKDMIPVLLKLVFLAVHVQIWFTQNRNPGTYDVLRNPVEFSNEYRSIEIMQNFFNYCFQYDYLPYHKLLMSSIAVFAFYGAIRIHGTRALIMAIINIIICLHLSVIFRQLGKLHDSSTKMLNSWKGISSRMVLKSCRPLRVQVSDHYYVQKTTILVLMGVIINAAITLLLSS